MRFFQGVSDQLLRTSFELEGLELENEVFPRWCFFCFPMVLCFPLHHRKLRFNLKLGFVS